MCISLKLIKMRVFVERLLIYKLFLNKSEGSFKCVRLGVARVTHTCGGERLMIPWVSNSKSRDRLRVLRSHLATHNKCFPVSLFLPLTSHLYLEPRVPKTKQNPIHSHSLNSNGHSHTLLSPIPCNVKKEKHSQNNKTYLLKPTSLLHFFLHSSHWLYGYFFEREREIKCTTITSLIRRRLQILLILCCCSYCSPPSV